MSDRTVHAETTTEFEVVRYDRAGKWFLEGPYTKKPLTLRDAVYYAVVYADNVHLGLPGGKRFDSAYRKHRRQS